MISTLVRRILPIVTAVVILVDAIIQQHPLLHIHAYCINYNNNNNNIKKRDHSLDVLSLYQNDRTTTSFSSCSAYSGMRCRKIQSRMTSYLLKNEDEINQQHVEYLNDTIIFEENTTPECIKTDRQNYLVTTTSTAPTLLLLLSRRGALVRGCCATTTFVGTTTTTAINFFPTTNGLLHRSTMIANALIVPSASTSSKTMMDTTSTTTNNDNISVRLQTNQLQRPMIGTTTTTSNGIDQTTYPSYLAGTWNVTQTLVSIDTPMGIQYVGGPNGMIEIAEKSINESKSRIGQPVSLQLRYIRCTAQKKKGDTTSTSKSDDDDAVVVVLEDRLYNTRSRLNAFAGNTVVANVAYADTQSSNQNSMNQLYPSACSIESSSSSPPSDTTSVSSLAPPLTTTITYFKGPAAQKVFVLAHHDSSTTNGITDTSSSSSWTGYEYQRSLFALTNGSTAPPITTDTEMIYQFTPDRTTDGGRHTNQYYDPIHHIRGKLRIIGYLNPNDKYYFDVQNRAVIIQDYILDMRRI